MRTWMRITLLLAVASGLTPPGAVAQPAVMLKLSWDHCAGDGYVGDRSFACDTNTGGDSFYGSMVINDGLVRSSVSSFEAKIDISTTSTVIPAWWQVIQYQCRSGAIGVDYGSFAASGGCPLWYAPSGLDSPLGVFSIQQGTDVTVRLELGAAVPAGSEVTLPAGQELRLFRVFVTHARSTGADACTGCTVPACIGFGYLSLTIAGSPALHEEYVGDPASTVTWQGAYVSGYAPVPGYADGGAYHSYRADLGCTTGPVPARGRTWGLIKTMYR